MNQRSALLIAAALTAFLLVLAGGLASRLSSDVGAMDVTPTAITTLEPSPLVSLDPSVEALIQEREAAYQQALDEANAQLEVANAQIAQANEQIGSLEQSRQEIADQAAQAVAVASRPVVVAPAVAPAVVVPTAVILPTDVPAPTYAVSGDQARDIALGVADAGATLLKTPELVSYQGVPAYEVTLDKGMVYVDAQTAAVLFNSAVAPKLISQELAMQSAQAYMRGGDVQSVQLQQDQGVQTYVVIFGDGSKIYVDALNGHVVYAEIRTPPPPSAPQYTDDDDHDDDHDDDRHDDDHDDDRHDDDHDD